MIRLKFLLFVGMLALLPPQVFAQQDTQASVRESSLTLAQIVQLQEANYARIKNADGEVIWQEQSVTSSTAPSTRVLFFATEGDNSVLLALPWQQAQVFPSRSEKIDWSTVLSAFLVEGDLVYRISQAPGAKAPTVETMPFNPAVHERNPLVSFHPRLLGDEHVSLADLSSVSRQMANRPRVLDVQTSVGLRLRVDFANSKMPGDALYYIIDPARGYLAEQIGRIQNGKPAMLSTIQIGRTADGIWIPSYKDRILYDAAGKAVLHEIWRIRFISVNQGLARRAISFLYFHLPPETRFLTTPTPSPSAGKKPAPSPTPLQRRAATPAPQPGRAPGRR